MKRKPLRAFFIVEGHSKSRFSGILFKDSEGIHAVCLELGLNSNSQRNEKEAIEALLASILAYNYHNAQAMAKGVAVEESPAPESYWAMFRESLSRKKDIQGYSMPAYASEISKKFHIPQAQIA